MPSNMPEIQIDNTYSAPQGFLHVDHARRYDGTRGVQIVVGTPDRTGITFMDYTEAVRLHEALSAALAFLDADDE